MSRRDTIILAVLINAGLLVVLFISALKTDGGEDFSPVNTALAQEETATSETATSPETPAKPEVKAEEQVAAVKKSKPAEPSSTRSHVVSKGDYLEKIAKKHKVSIDEIIALNNLPNSRLQIGQELRIPEPSQAKGPVVKKQEEEKYYIIKGGDSPWTIAIKNQMQVDDLLKLNNMDESKAKRLRPGDRLRIK